MKTPLAGIIALCMLGIAMPISFGADAANPTPPKMMSMAEITTDPGLQMPVSLEAKRKPLAELLNDLSKQSGVQLQPATEGAIPDVRVTVAVKSMALGAMLNSLARLYDITWTRQAPGKYLLWPSRRTALEKTLLQLGDTSHLNMSYNSMSDAWQAAKKLDADKLAQPDGIAFHDLPADFQGQLRGSVEEQCAQNLLRQYLQVMPSNIDRYTLLVGRSQNRVGGKPGTENPGIISLAFRKPDGSFMPVYDWIATDDNTVIQQMLLAQGIN